MVNINTALPTTLTAAFHPASEALHHDNLTKPIIPKTEAIAQYTQLREDEEREGFSDQTRHILQDENQQDNSADEQEQQQSMAEQQRLRFFAKRSLTEEVNEAKELVVVKDFKLTLAVIQERYNNAVTPTPNPTVDCQL